MIKVSKASAANERNSTEAWGDVDVIVSKSEGTCPATNGERCEDWDEKAYNCFNENGPFQCLATGECMRKPK